MPLAYAPSRKAFSESNSHVARVVGGFEEARETVRSRRLAVLECTHEVIKTAGGSRAGRGRRGH